MLEGPLEVHLRIGYFLVVVCLLDVHSGAIMRKNLFVCIQL